MAKDRGFTLIELVITVSVLSALGVVVFSIINQQSQRQRAQDAVNRTHLDDVSQAIESYNAGEGRYPYAVSNLPDYATKDPHMTEYLSQAKWPSGFIYAVNATYDLFDVYFASLDGSTYYKYSSSYGKVKHCTSANIATLGACTEI